MQSHHFSIPAPIPKEMCWKHHMDVYETILVIQGPFWMMMLRFAGLSISVLVNTLKPMSS